MYALWQKLPILVQTCSAFYHMKSFNNICYSAEEPNILRLTAGTQEKPSTPQLPAATQGKPSMPQLTAETGKQGTSQPSWVNWNPASLKSPVSEVLQLAAKSDGKNDDKGTSSSGKLALSRVINTRKRRPALHPTSVDAIHKAKQDYLELQKKLALEQGAREAELFDIRCEKE